MVLLLWTWGAKRGLNYWMLMQLKLQETRTRRKVINYPCYKIERLAILVWSTCNKVNNLKLKNINSQSYELMIYLVIFNFFLSEDSIVYKNINKSTWMHAYLNQICFSYNQLKHFHTVLPVNRIKLLPGETGYPLVLKNTEETKNHHKVMVITEFHLYLIQLWWSFSNSIVNSNVVNSQTWAVQLYYFLKIQSSHLKWPLPLVLVAQWIECHPVFGGSWFNSFRGLGFFLCPILVTQWSFHPSTFHFQAYNSPSLHINTYKCCLTYWLSC